ncbi:Uncharacterized protein APZ42_034571 [Daphnia magna]|uniref:Uncharacterized protein n=1 Tax=Daphnia magna TaxID=35525 RepID=A0A164K0W4_9CRUS|nr:Uncharacterized protein APZ42_034571 [Daphnia magna]
MNPKCPTASLRRIPSMADPVVPAVADPVVPASGDPVFPITNEIENAVIVVHLDHSYGTNGAPTTVEVEEDQPRQKRARVDEIGCS